MSTILRTAAVALALGLAAPAVAQQPMQPEPMAREELTQPKLDAFVTAAAAVRDIVETRRGEVEAAADADEQARITEEINTEIVAAVDEVPDITLDEYVQIVELVRRDPALADQVRQMLEAS